MQAKQIPPDCDCFGTYSVLLGPDRRVRTGREYEIVKTAGPSSNINRSQASWKSLKTLAAEHGPNRWRQHPDENRLPVLFSPPQSWRSDSGHRRGARRVRVQSRQSLDRHRPFSATELNSDIIQASKRGPRIMRYELTDFEWTAIRSLLPNKPRGIPRVTTGAS